MADTPTHAQTWAALCQAIAHPSRERADHARDTLAVRGRADFEDANGLMAKAQLTAFAVIESSEDEHMVTVRGIARTMLVIADADYPNKGVCA